MRPDKPGVLRTAIALAIVAGLAAVGLLDYVTGPWLSFALFYVVPVLGAAAVLLVAAIAASVVPAARAARVNVMDALRAE